jgi:hypothetical protein
MTLRNLTVAVIASGITVGAAFTPLVRLLLLADIGHCGHGLDALGCAVFSVYATLLVAVLISGLLLGVLLKTFAVPTPWVIGFLAAANVGAAWWLIRSIHLSPSIVFPVCFSLFALLHFWICQRLLHTMRSMGTGLAIVIASFGILTPFGNKYDSAQFRRQQVKETQDIGFKLYAPTFLPSGYRLYSAAPHTRVAYANYYELTYLYGHNDPGDPPPFTIYQFKRPAEYHPPEHCGELFPISKGEITQPCQLLDESESNKIYYAEEPRLGLYGWFMAKDDILVTMQAVTGKVDRGVFIHVLRSLHEVSPENLAAMK